MKVKCNRKSHVQEYECKYESNSELPIDIAIEEYKKYMEWKGANQ